MMFIVGFIIGFASYWIVWNVVINRTDKNEYVESHRDKFYGR